MGRNYFIRFHFKIIIINCLYKNCIIYISCTPSWVKNIPFSTNFSTAPGMRPAKNGIIILGIAANYNGINPYFGSNVFNRVGISSIFLSMVAYSIDTCPIQNWTKNKLRKRNRKRFFILWVHSKLKQAFAYFILNENCTTLLDCTNNL